MRIMLIFRHPSEGWGPRNDFAPYAVPGIVWIPAFAGMTRKEPVA
jgi:hypothetical protein